MSEAEMLLAAMLSGNGKDDGDGDRMVPVTEKDVGGFQPIKDLKPGDRVMLRGEHFNRYNYISAGAVLTVFRVCTPVACAERSDTNCEDFTVLFADKKHIVEFSLDSRRFMRVGDK